MARHLILLGGVAMLAAALFWSGVANTPAVDPGASRVSPSPSVDSPQPGPQLDEINAWSSRRAYVREACGDAAVQASEEALRAEQEIQREQMLRVLASSADPEHLLTAALVSWKSQPEKALQLLGKAATMNPRSPLVASQALELCLVVESCGQSPAALEDNLISADKANGLAWVQVARSRLKRNDDRGALAAMYQAAAAPAIEEHFVDYVLLFDRGLAASADLRPFDRHVAALGHAAAIVSSGLNISRDCFERGRSSAEWRDACLRVSQQFELAGRAMLTQVIGLGIQENMYEYGGDLREQEQVAARLRQAKDEWAMLAAESASIEQLQDVTVTRRYLETFASAGELAAMRYLSAEAEARSPELTGVPQPGCPTP